MLNWLQALFVIVVLTVSVACASFCAMKRQPVSGAGCKEEVCDHDDLGDVNCHCVE